MNQTDLKLYELLGDKTLSFGCQVILNEWIGEKTIKGVNGFNQFRVCGMDKDFTIADCESVVGHEPTIADLHRWMNDDEELVWEQDNAEIRFDMDESGLYKNFIPYDSSKSLLSQSEETKSLIIWLIENGHLTFKQ